MNKTEKKSNLGFLAFLPLIVFLAIYIGSGIYFSNIKADDPFKQVPRHVALLIGALVAFLMQRKIPISKKLDVFTENMGNSGVMTIVLIYLLAGGFQEVASAMGAKDSIVNLCLNHIPQNLLIPGVFLMGAIISTAIGSSMGTIAALAPVAVSVANGANLNMPITCAAIIGGAYFGDNLSMISDTTISATQGVGAEMKDKFKMNFLISVPAAIAAFALYAIFGGSGEINELGSYNIIQIIPYISVIIFALMGINVVLVLFIGIGLAGLIGLLEGNLTILTFLQAIGNGMEGMLSISIVAILVSGIIGLVRFYGGIDWLVYTISKKIKSRKTAEYGIAFMTGIISAALINNTIGIIISAPMAKEIGEKYNIAPKRLASLLDIFACAFLALMPHDGGMLIVTSLANVSPIEVLKYSYYIFALIIAGVITIQFGLLRTKEEKETK
ncbi:Na+/H+ antiporter NhaC family protein [Anaerococcus rubeinfantis]|uniref:Na+/H+ antiporter NhaC family protein n=1 Tax=Anaerococcus rubeinfantis TaxID=1720199 RepID=UPI00073F5A18|nr:Na+/H+ antiporter NhaC family protein [Anaerococcus rubeinfantis]